MFPCDWWMQECEGMGKGRRKVVDEWVTSLREAKWKWESGVDKTR